MAAPSQSSQSLGSPPPDTGGRTSPLSFGRPDSVSGRSGSSVFSRSRLPFRFSHTPPSSSSTSELREPSSAEKGPFGLTTLHLPSPGNETIAHVVFVHGLGGGSEHTWTHGYTFWPRDLLPMQQPFQNTAIHSFGYNSDFTKSSTLNIYDFSKALLASMRHNPHILDKRPPIILVAHSMGGLVVKKAYAIARGTAGYEDLAKKIKAVFFIATPQLGSDLAPTLTRIFRLSSGLKPFLKDLERNSDAVRDINREFTRYSRELFIYSFYETRPLKVGKFRDVMIVPKEDAILNHADEYTELLNGDHRSICKFDSASDTNFIAIWQALAACLRSLSVTMQNSATTTQEPALEELGDHLGVYEPPADDLHRVKTERLAGTCEWLLNNGAYNEWEQASGAKMLWLRAPAGSGKSFLAGFAIEKYEQMKAPCCYYFFSHGDKVQSSMEGFLLSMTLQIAAFSPIILERVLEICKRNQDLGKADYRTLLRKIWEQAILKVELNRTMYWVVDALDECSAPSELTKFLDRVREKTNGSVRILITTRNTPTEYFASSDHIIFYEMQTEDIQQDIGKYLDAHINEISGATQAERKILRDNMLSKANGCFLWAILVFRRLVKIPGAQARLRALDELQPGMDELYSRILTSMSAREKDISKVILTWVACSVRPLRVEELQYVLAQRTMDDIAPVEDLISTHCHDLVYVDSKFRVRMRHASAKRFLLRRDINAQFDQALTIREEDANKTLALACLDYLNGPEMQIKPKRRRRATQERSIFVSYSCQALHEHINRSSAADGDIVTGIANFLRSNILTWIEHLAKTHDLDTVLHMAQVLRVFLRRKSKIELLLGDDVVIVDNWATDLVKLVSKFGHQLQAFPESILYLIPPFCPTESAPYMQFAANPSMALSVHGLTNAIWDACLCTVKLSSREGTLSSDSGSIIRRERLHSIATSDKHFCIGTSVGRVAVFNQRTCVQEQSLDHGSQLHPRESGVLKVQFAAMKPLMASVSRRLVRIWNTETWELQWEVPITNDCLALSFADADSLLFLALANNELWDLDLTDQVVREKTKWTDGLQGNLAAWLTGSYAAFAAFDPDFDLLVVAYRNHDVLVWNYEEDTHHVYNIFKGRYEPTTKAGFSVEALTFSRLPTSSLLAVNYNTADMVVFDAIAGSIKAKTTKVNFTRLISSTDGRTLAGARRDGTIELYDFETLHKLFRMAPVDGAVSALAFSMDSTRLLEIRAGGQVCRIWDPPALFRRDVGHDSVRTPSTYSSDSLDQAWNDTPVPDPDVTYIECDELGDVFFVGKEDATVSIHDMKSGNFISLLFSHKASIKSLHYISRQQRLVSIDTAGILMIHSINRSGGAWLCDCSFIRRASGVSLQQFLCNDSMSRFLVHVDGSASVASLPDDVVVATSDDAAICDSISSCWAQHPKDPNLLLLLTPSAIHVFTWDSLQRVSPAVGYPLASGPLHTDLRLRDISSFDGGLLLTTTSPGARGQSHVICLPYNTLTSSNSNIGGAVAETTSIDCMCIVGSWRDRIVFLHADGWICSVRMATLLRGEELTDDDVSHHFPPPNDWLQTNREPIVRVSRHGDVLFVVRHEVAIVKRGLDRSFDVRNANG